MTYQYKTDIVKWLEIDYILTKRGQEGWLLCSITKTPNTVDDSAQLNTYLLIFTKKV